MKIVIILAATLAGYVGLALAQDGPLQVWLTALAPVAFLLLAFVLQVLDAPPR